MDKPLNDTRGRHNNQRATDNVFNGVAQYLMTRPARFWALRLYVCLDVLATCVIAVLSAISLNGPAFSGLAENFGWAISIVVFTAAMCGLLDVLINSLAPARFNLQFVHRHRWVLFMTIALGMAAFIYSAWPHSSIPKSPSLYALILRYALDCFGCVVIVTLDFMERGQERLDESPHEQARPH